MVYFLTQLPRSSAKLVASVTFLVMGLMQEASSVMRMQIAVWQPRWPLDHTPQCWKTARILKWIVKRVALRIVSIAGSCYILRIFWMDFKNFNSVWAVSTLNATTLNMTSNCNRIEREHDIDRLTSKMFTRASKGMPKFKTGPLFYVIFLLVIFFSCRARTTFFQNN